VRGAKVAKIVIYAAGRQEFEDVLGITGVVLVALMTNDYFLPGFVLRIGGDH
jgi:hypothetical protein